MSCKECLKVCPEARQPFNMHGDMLPALCKYCPSSDNGNPIIEDMVARVTFLEDVDQPVNRHLRSEVQQLKASNLYIQRQVKELQIKKKKGDRL